MKNNKFVIICKYEAVFSDKDNMPYKGCLLKKGQQINKCFPDNCIGKKTREIDKEVLENIIYKGISS